MAASNMQQPNQSLEALENRTFLSATPLKVSAVKASKVASAYLDNRGQVFMLFTVGLDKSTLSRKTAALYIAGTDGLFGTADDLRLNTKVGYTRGRLSLRSSALALNQAYRVRLNGAVIKDANGNFLDGEFNGMESLSGNGHAGGNFDIVAKPASKAKVRFTTIAGFINVGLYNNTPNTKSNFLHYTNEGAYDNTIFHRSVRFNDPNNPPNQAFKSQFDILQGGGYLLDTVANHTTKVHNHGPINNEGTNLNTKGTIAMANAGANTATTEYFFNVNSNTAAFDTTPGTYAVFGAVLDAGSQQTLDDLAALDTSLNELFPLSEDGQGGTGHEFGHYNVPIRDIAALNARGSISDVDDLVIVSRAAQLFDYGATPNVQAAAVTANAVAAVAAAPALSPAIATAFSAKKIEDDPSLFDAAA